MVVLAAYFLVSPPAYGDSHLLYFEAQGVAGYSSLQSKAIYYSMNPDAEMQKPSLGFDYLRRFAGEAGDWGSLGLQGRMALSVYEDGTEKVELQAYNAWFKVKTPWTDVWIGHNRPALGLGSYFDSHPLILRTLPIQGFGYDRDWGVGTYRDFSWGNLQLSATTGTGMPVYFKGNYMLASRIAYGVLNEDNYTLGLSVGYGQTLDTMGYLLRDRDPRDMRLVGTDFAFLRNNMEHRFDIFAGRWLDQETVAAMYRIGYLFGPEQRMKVELQPTYWRVESDRLLLSACFSALVTSDLTFRTMYEYDNTTYDQRVIGQLYYYLPI
ncbi:MAG TPA: hypothetical protein VFR01_02690 [Geobacterales bacterium]|nr:hypothetical protein [Geobacterales bacterium]